MARPSMSTGTRERRIEGRAGEGSARVLLSSRWRLAARGAVRTIRRVRGRFAWRRLQRRLSPRRSLCPSVGTCRLCRCHPVSTVRRSILSAKRLFVEDGREPPPRERRLVGGPGEDAAPFHRVRRMAVFALIWQEKTEEDRVGGTIRQDYEHLIKPRKHGAA